MVKRSIALRALCVAVVMSAALLPGKAYAQM
jgi:hypothetical protein